MKRSIKCPQCDGDKFFQCEERGKVKCDLCLGVGFVRECKAEGCATLMSDNPYTANTCSDECYRKAYLSKLEKGSVDYRFNNVIDEVATGVYSITTTDATEPAYFVGNVNTIWAEIDNNG